MGSLNKFIDQWCNGSTKVSGTFCWGSSPYWSTKRSPAGNGAFFWLQPVGDENPWVRPQKLRSKLLWVELRRLFHRRKRTTINRKAKSRAKREPRRRGFLRSKNQGASSIPTGQPKEVPQEAGLFISSKEARLALPMRFACRLKSRGERMSKAHRQRRLPPVPVI